MVLRPYDIESRGRLPNRRFRNIRPRWYEIAAAAGSTIGTIYRGVQNAKRTLPPSPSMSRSRGRSITRRPAKRARYSRSRSRSRGYSQPRITTEQVDSAVHYTAGRRNRYRARRWRKFTNRVQHVMLQMGATQQWTRTYKVLKVGALNTQVYDGVMLGGTTADNNDELFQSFRRAYGSTLNIADLDDYRLFIKSLCLDMAITNTGDKNIIIEMYTLACRKNYNAQERIDVQLTNTMAEVPIQTNYSFGATNPGYSLFQATIFLQYWKILRKQQIVISPGETTTMQLRIPTNRMFQGKRIETHPQSIPGYTKAFFWMVKGSPEENTGGTDVQFSDFRFCVTQQQTVNYQIPPSTSRAALSTLAV